MHSLRKFSRVHKNRHELHPIALGKGMALGVIWPLPATAVFVFAFAALFALTGSGPLAFIGECVHKILAVSIPISKALAGTWISYSLIYFAITFIATGAYCKLVSVPFTWILVGDAYLRLKDKTLQLHRYIFVTSSAFQQPPLRPATLDKVEEYGLPPHLAIGWQASINP